jgi:DNA polymerase-3 subunit alpha
MKTDNYSNIKDFSDKFQDTELDIHGVRLPEFEIDLASKRHLGISEDASNYDFLRALSLNGFKTLNIDKTNKDYKKYVDRAKHELDTLKELGFIDYILLVWDVIHFCKTSDIPVGLGRGSAAGSLILYLVGVTRIDPVKYDLYFERFISKIRAKKQVVDGVTYLDGSLMCDVDLDICYYNRQKVLQYLENKFKGKTSKILTFNSLSGKLLIKECGKIVAEKPEQEMTMISSLIPKTYGQVKDISEAYQEVEQFKEWCDQNKEAYKIALKLRDLIKNKGVHPSGVLLSYYDLETICPTEFSSDKEVVSSFDMNWASVFNIKLDILGLRSVSVVDNVC